MTKEQKLKMAYDITVEYMRTEHISQPNATLDHQAKINMKVKQFAENFETVYNAIEKNEILNKIF